MNYKQDELHQYTNKVLSRELSDLENQNKQLIANITNAQQTNENLSKTDAILQTIHTLSQTIAETKDLPLKLELASSLKFFLLKGEELTQKLDIGSTLHIGFKTLLSIAVRNDVDTKIKHDLLDFIQQHGPNDLKLQTKKELDENIILKKMESLSNTFPFWNNQQEPYHPETDTSTISPKI